MAIEDENPNPSPVTPIVPRARDGGSIVSDTGSSQPHNPAQDDVTASATKPQSSKDFIISVATKISSQPLQNFDPEVWGVLTAISNCARKRRQVPTPPVITSVLLNFGCVWFDDMVTFGKLG